MKKLTLLTLAYISLTLIFLIFILLTKDIDTPYEKLSCENKCLNDELILHDCVIPNYTPITCRDSMTGDWIKEICKLRCEAK